MNNEGSLGLLQIRHSHEGVVFEDDTNLEPDAFVDTHQLELVYIGEDEREHDIGSATVDQIQTGNAQDAGYGIAFPFDATQALDDLFQLICDDEGNVFWLKDDIATEMYPHSILFLDDLRIRTAFAEKPIFDLVQ